MPNHCVNKLTITGPKAERERFLAGLKNDSDGKPQLMESYVPMPEPLRTINRGFANIGEDQVERWRTKPDGTMEAVSFQEDIENLAKYGARDWYAWANNNWGTKWGDYDHAPLIITASSIQMRFNSAWAPVSIIKIAEQFPKLTFKLRYFEQGSGFQGSQTFQHGTLTGDWTGDYHGDLGG